MSIAQNYPMTGMKKVNELRSCKGCNLTVMAKGDWQGWKGIDMGLGQMDWFCDKTACRQLRDETIARRSQEMLAERREQEAVAAKQVEVDALKARVAELEKERQTTAEIAATEWPADVSFETPAAAPVVTGAPIESHIVGPDGKALCGALDGPMLKPQELNWDVNPCPRCSAKWQAIMNGTAAAAPKEELRDGFVYETRSSDGRSTYKVIFRAGGTTPFWECECEGFKHRSQCRHVELATRHHGVTPAPATADVTLAAPGASQEVRLASPEATAAQGAVPASDAAAALYGERPKPMALEATRFSQELIDASILNPDTYVAKPILVTPDVYSHLDMATISPERLRGGITALFKDSRLQVDRIERATQNGVFAGILFTLRRVG